MMKSNCCLSRSNSGASPPCERMRSACAVASTGRQQRAGPARPSPRTNSSEVRLAAEQLAEPGGVGPIEEPVQHGAAEVGVDQQVRSPARARLVPR